MAKLKPIGNLNLFEPQVVEEQTKAEHSSPPKIKDPCPRCGARSATTKRNALETGGSHYCLGGCLSEDRTDAFYFTPKVESFDEAAAREEAKKIIASEEPEPPIIFDEIVVTEMTKEPMPRASKFGKLDLPIKPYFEENGIAILHGDNREILPQLGIYDLILTDPPYGVGLEYSAWKDTQSNLKELIKTSFPLIRRSATVLLLTPGNGNQYKYPEPDWTLAWVVPAAVTRGAWGFCSWQPVLAYGKDPYLREGEGARPDIIICNEASDVNGHPCPKPDTVWKWLVKRGASRATDDILDPFLGSGTTLVVAKALGHRAVGIEIEEKYCEIAAKRLSQGVLSL
jgi:hypothetical protein